MRGVIHCNPSIEWQRKYSLALKSGLDLFGIYSEITNDKLKEGDVTVVLGPHWCKEFHKEKVIYIDRAYWGDPMSVSIHWMVNGAKIFNWEEVTPRPHPELKPLKQGRKAIIINDFKTRFKVADLPERFHPSENIKQPSLKEQLNEYDVAYGGVSTAMVDAAILGLKVVSLQDNSPVAPLSCSPNADREKWITALAWHNWSLQEIQVGSPWEHFLK